MGGQFVIAGGSRGIGRELVRLLEPDADRIHVLSREMEPSPESDKVVHHAVDFCGDNPPIRELPKTIDGAAYCPGSITLRSFRSLGIDDFRADLEINFLGAVKFLQAVQAGLTRRKNDDPASVVLFSSVAAETGLPMHSSIAAAKGAVQGMARSLAAEWAPAVRVNCLAPALTDTPLAARFLASPGGRETMAARYPLARTGKTADPASLARFLLLPDSGWITGQVIGVDGGMSSLRIS